MLDYVKHRPRWRHPKGKSNESYSQDILAFKQVYLSAAASTYRKNLAKKAHAVFYGRITALRHEDAAREELLLAVDFSRRDPFQHIFKQNNMSGDDISGFFKSDAPQDASAFPRIAGGAAVRNGGASSPKKGRSLTAPLMKHEVPNIELIKLRINSRRAMNPSINGWVALSCDQLCNQIAMGMSGRREVGGEGEGGGGESALTPMLRNDLKLPNQFVAA